MACGMLENWKQPVDQFQVNGSCGYDELVAIFGDAPLQ